MRLPEARVSRWEESLLMSLARRHSAVVRWRKSRLMRAGESPTRSRGLVGPKVDGGALDAQLGTSIRLRETHSQESEPSCTPAGQTLLVWHSNLQREESIRAVSRQLSKGDWKA